MNSTSYFVRFQVRFVPVWVNVFIAILIVSESLWLYQGYSSKLFTIIHSLVSQPEEWRYTHDL